MDALGGGPALGHGADKLLDRLDAGAGGKNIGRTEPAGGRVGLESSAGQRHAEFLAVAFGQFADGEQDGVEPAPQTVQSHLIAQLDAGFEINSHPRQQRDFRVEDGGGQFAFRHVPQPSRRVWRCGQ